MKIALSIFLLLFAIAVPPSLGHEGPAEIIQRLSHRIDSGKGTGEDYRLRALEWRFLGKSDRAARDLRLALRRDPDCLSAWQELARVSLVLNDPNGAVDAARRALELSEKTTTLESSTGARLLLAEVLLQTGRPDSARATIDEAFSLRTQQGVDAWWLRAEIFADLNDETARLDCLKKGWQQTASEALRIAWIEAAIAMGHRDDVLVEVEKSLKRCRLKAAWRVRRAHILLSCEEKALARNDLLLAMEELQGRLNPTRPDPAVEKDLLRARTLFEATLRE